MEKEQDADDWYREPIQVRPYRGGVIVDGLGNLSLGLTADAAEQSALRLLDAAIKAREWIDPALGSEREG